MSNPALDANTQVEDQESEAQDDVEATHTPSQEGQGNQESGQSENEGEGTPEPTGFDALPEETQREIRSLRKQNAKFRSQLSDIEQKLEDKYKSEVEERDNALTEAQRKAADAEDKYRQAIGKAQVLQAAPKANARSANAVYACIKDQIEFDDEGTPTNVEDLIEALKKDDPDLFRTTSLDGGKGTPASTSSMNERIRRDAGRK